MHLNVRPSNACRARARGGWLTRMLGLRRRQAAGDMRLMNPVSQVENHPLCRTNPDGEPLLPNDTVWRQQLVMFITSSKLLVDTENVLQIKQEPAQSRTQCAARQPH